MDASSLAKRYNVEIGTPLINHLFTNVPLSRLIVFSIGIGEVLSLLVRKKNAGRISPAAYRQAVVDFHREIAYSTAAQKVVATNAVVTAALPFIEKHSLNATDAVVLRSALAL